MATVLPGLAVWRSYRDHACRSRASPAKLGAKQVEHGAAPAARLGLREGRCEGLGRCPDGEVGSREEAGEAIDQDEMRDSLRMGRCVGHRHEATADVGNERCAIGPDLIEDHRHVVHPLLDRRESRRRDRVGEPGAAFVEHDQPTE
jgi:hypothetical protein